MAGELIRPATAADGAAIAIIYAPFVCDNFVSFEEAAPDPAEFARRIAGDDRGLFPWLVVEAEGELLGYAAASPLRARAAYRWSVETGVYLAAAAQGRGMGTTLMRAMIDLLTRQGFVTAVAGIALPNPSSVAFHERLGFQEIGRYRGTGFKAGAWRDVGIWQRDLAPREIPPREPRPFAGLL